MSSDEEKTRVLQKRAKESAPALVGEKIVFHCPNGHRIVVSASYAGKRGKCSKCDIDVTIPRPGVENAPLPVAVAPPALPAAAAPAAAAPVVPPVGVPDLHFQPPPEPVVEATAAEPEAAGDEAPGGETWDFISPQPAAPAADDFEADAWQSVDAPAVPAEGGNATAMLVGRLWAERQNGGVIELHLAGGGVILPEWYDANWSRGTHGLFASQAADGSVTLTAVAWETVQKIVVRQLAVVPNDMFT